MSMFRYLREKYFFSWLIFTFLLWGLIFFLLKDKDSPLLFAVLYTLVIVLILYFFQNILIPKLSVFSQTAQIVLKAFLYGSGFIAGYIIVFFIQSIVTIPLDSLISQTADYFYQGVERLFSGPLLSGKVDRLLTPEIQSAFTTLFILFFLIGMISIAGSYIDTRWRQVKMEHQLNEARIKILQTQMQPHFLFNTLNSIVSIVRKDPDRAESLLIHLSDFFRYSLKTSQKPYISLKDELAFLEDFLILLQARYGEKLHWKITTAPECMEQIIPAMILQPLVENSIKHGWKDHKITLNIRIKCFLDNGKFILQIADDGKGIKIFDRQKFPPRGHALDNIRERLERYYNNSNLLKISPDQNGGTVVEIHIPRSEK